MKYDIFKAYGLDKIKDSLTENFDSKDTDYDKWTEVNQKSVLDSDGFTTDYTWYTDGEKHIFMFGDSEIYPPDEDYADWVCDSEEEASEWFASYRGFEEDEEYDFDEDDFDNEPKGNSDFLNDGFQRVFGDDLDLED